MDRNYIYGVIKPYRQDFITNPNQDEMKIMSDHFSYLQNLYKQGKLFLAGPTLIQEDPTGIFIFDTRNLEDAKTLLENDPSIKAGIQIIQELRPIRLSLARSLDEF